MSVANPRRLAAEHLTAYVGARCSRVASSLALAPHEHIVQAVEAEARAALEYLGGGTLEGVTLDDKGIHLFVVEGAYAQSVALAIALVEAAA